MSRITAALEQRKKLRKEQNKKINTIKQEYDEPIKILTRIIEESNRKGIGKRVKEFNRR